MGDAEIDVKSHPKRKPYVDISTDQQGHPLLPPKQDWPERVTDRHSLVRAFVAAAYRESA